MIINFRIPFRFHSSNIRLRGLLNKFPFDLSDFHRVYRLLSVYHCEKSINADTSTHQLIDIQKRNQAYTTNDQYSNYIRYKNKQTNL